MSEMVERLARAYEAKLWSQLDSPIADSWYQSVMWHQREASLQRARIAIGAMREPTEAMVRAGMSSVKDAIADGDPLGINTASAWERMIAAAIAEEPQP